MSQMKSRNNFSNPFETINTLMSERGISPEKLAYLTEVPKKFIFLIQEGDVSRLPPRPYVMGYLKKISAVLGADESSIIGEYENFFLRKYDGDKLPSNRFERDGGLWKFIIISIIIWALAGFLGYRFNDIAGVPGFKVNLPSSASSPALEISGVLPQGNSLSINGQTISTNADGSFSVMVSLSPGNNLFVFTIKRFLGGESTVTASTYYEPPSITP